LDRPRAYPVKRAHLAVHPDGSINYFATSHDTCSARAQCITHVTKGGFRASTIAGI
jgi:hypothetical protein